MSADVFARLAPLLLVVGWLPGTAIAQMPPDVPPGGPERAHQNAPTHGMMAPANGASADQPTMALTGPTNFRSAQSFSDPLALAQAETAQATFLAMTQFTQTLLDPAIGGRSGPSPALADDESAAYAALPAGRMRAAYEALYGKFQLTGSAFTPHWNVWAAGFGGSQVSTGSAMPGSSSASRSFGTVVGADYALTPRTMMGFAVAGGGTGFAGNFASGRSDLFQAGGFVRHTAGRAYVSGALAYGWQAITSDHVVMPPGADQINAAFDANAYSGRVEGGYRLASGWLGIAAYAAGQFTTFGLPANAGEAAPALNAFTAAFGGNSVTDSRSELGLRTSSFLALGDGLLNLRGRLAWAHDFSAAQALPAAFQALPGLGFVASGAALAPESALAGLALELRSLNGWFAAATLDSEFSSQVRSYTGRAVIRYAW